VSQGRREKGAKLKVGSAQGRRERSTVEVGAGRRSRDMSMEEETEVYIRFEIRKK
jgi:hypothetical protein